MGQRTVLTDLREPDEGDPTAVGVLDLLAELLGGHGHLGCDPAGAQQLGGVLRGAPGVLVGQGHVDGGGHGAAGGGHLLGEHAHHQSGDTDGQAHAREHAVALGRQRVVPAAGADRAQLLVSGEHRLVDRPGVVVQAAGDRQVGHRTSGGAAVQLTDHLGQLGQPHLQQLVLHTERADLLHEGGVLGPDLRQRQGLGGLLGGGAELLLEQLGHALGADLLQLVDGAQHPGGVLQPDPPVEALGELAVVDPQREVPDRQGAQGLGDHQGHVHVVPERQGAVTHHVDVRLRELPGPPLLRTFTAPDLLDLVAAEREGQVAGVLHHVAGEGHGQVEVQGQSLGVVGILGLRA